MIMKKTKLKAIVIPCRKTQEECMVAEKEVEKMVGVAEKVVMAVEVQVTLVGILFSEKMEMVEDVKD